MSNKKLPPWLSVEEPTKKERELLLDISSNWIELFKHRKELTEKQCLQIIKLELEGKSRPMMVGRVKIWYDNMRSRRELKELWGA